MASAPVGDEAICQIFLCAVGKSASRQSASQSCTRAGTCNVDHGAQSRTAAATTGTSHAATSTTILSLTLLPKQVTQQKAMTIPPSTSGLFLTPCAPPRYLQVFVACPRASLTCVHKKKNTTRKRNVHSRRIQLLLRGSPRTGGGVTPTSGAGVFPFSGCLLKQRQDPEEAKSI